MHFVPILKVRLRTCSKDLKEFLDAGPIKDVILLWLANLRDIDRDAYDRLFREVPESCRFPWSDVPITGITLTITYSSDEGYYISWHVDDKNLVGAKEASIRVNTKDDTTGGMYIADGLRLVNPLLPKGEMTSVGEESRLPGNAINIGEFGKVPHSVRKPSVGESYSFVPYVNAAVVRGAKLQDAGALPVNLKVKGNLKERFTRVKKGLMEAKRSVGEKRPRPIDSEDEVEFVREEKNGVEVIFLE
jgi:hypothetical protein